MSQSNNVELRLRDAKPILTPVERRVAEYVAPRLGSIPALNIKQLAQKSHTSEASVIRFCKALGYRGYRDFTLSLSAALGSMRSEESGAAEHYKDIRPGDDLNTIIENVSYNNRCSIDDTLAVLDKNEVARAVIVLREAARINLYGLGASGLVCQDAAQKFLRIRKNCQAFVDGHSLQTAAALLEQEDVAVLISNSGDTLEILDALHLVLKSGAKTIAITRYANSPLARQSDIVLRISTPEIGFRSGAMGSRIAMLNIVDVIFSGVASAEYEKIKGYLDRTHDALASRHNKNYE
ncbi:MAG: MurR/RpiR family transcriptional regulator [Ruthenibacterium sp.]